MNRRKTSANFNSRKRIHVCDHCGLEFNTKYRLQQHLKTSTNCKKILPFSCDFCNYAGQSEYGLQRHHFSSPQCLHFVNESKVLTGVLPDMHVGETNHRTSNPGTSTYQYNRYSTNGELDQVLLNLEDDTLHKRNEIMESKNQMLSDNINTSYTTYIQQAGAQLKQGDNITISEPDVLLTHDHEAEKLSKQLERMDIRSKQERLRKRFKSLTFSHSEAMCMDLFHMLQASNSPLVMFDRIIEWVRRHEATIKRAGMTSLLKRNNLIETLNKKLYLEEGALMKPKISYINLHSNRTTKVVTFSFREMILRMITNKALFHPDNLLIDPKNPFADPPESKFFGEVNTGTWFKEAKRNECRNPKEILMPFCHFIDGLAVDKYGKISVEAVMTCCLWFNRKARNRTSTWWVQGFIEDQKLFKNQKNYVKNDKLQDYHDMMTEIFAEMKDIRDSGGLKLTLDFGSHGVHDVIAIPVIQYIVGDCKGNDVLCGRKGGHEIRMKGLCRDCNISPQDGDDVCLETPLKCKFLTKDDVLNKTQEELDSISFWKINNCFSHLSFGGCPRNVYGGTPPEILHLFLLGLCDYIAEGMHFLFTKSAIDTISQVVVGIYADSNRQSERDLPDMGPFRNGLIDVKVLKAKERFSRIYCLFLALGNSFLINMLINSRGKRKRDDLNNDAQILNIPFLSKYFEFIQDTLIFHLWLKKDKYKKEDFYVKRRHFDSKASKRIKEYLIMFKQHVTRGGNNLKTPKFHQMLHICDYIQRHGSPLNYDGSRGENFGKVKVKDNAKLTNKNKDTLNLDIGKRIAEEDIINQASVIYHNNNGHWPSDFCNDIDIAMNANRLQSKNHKINYLERQSNTYPRYSIVCAVEYNEHDNSIPEDVNVRIDWGAQNKIPLSNFPNHILRKLAARLYIGSPNIGGKITPESLVHGYTEIIQNGFRFRAHPSYNSAPWYDWAFFRWEGFDELIAAKIIMVIDLSDAEILNQPDKDPDDPSSDNVPFPSMKHLTKEKWAVVLAANKPVADNKDLTNAHFTSKIITRIQLHSDDEVWMVPLSTLVSPCFVVPNKEYCANEIRHDTYADDRTAYIVKPMSAWGDMFLL